MPGFEYGIERAIVSIASGIAMSAMLNALTSFPNISYSITVTIMLLKIIMILGSIEVIRVMKYWSTLYLLGWIIGYIIFFPTSLLNVEDIFTGIIIPSLYIIWRESR